MEPGIGAHLLVGLVAALTTWACVPLTERLAHRLGAVAQPDERRVHQRATPTLGGLAMLAGVLAALLLAWVGGAFDEVFGNERAVWSIAAASVAIYAVGLIDDVMEISAPAKIAGLVLAGSLLTIGDVSLVFFRFPFLGVVVLTPDLSVLVTVLWVIVMANAVNLVDGLDGLAAGIVGIAAAAFFVYTVQLANAGLLQPDNPAPVLVVAVAGVCAGFLPHNFHPARTFMGDGGALLLGLTMAAATVSVGGQTRDEFSGQTYFFFAPLVIPLVILGVPVLDTIFAVLRRARNRSGVATADKGHLHHRLMNLGHGQRRSVLIMWTWTTLLSGVALYPTITGKGDGLVLFGLAALALLLYTYLHPGVRRHRQRRDGDDRDPEDPDRNVGPNAVDAP
ncbi:MAG: undecaprenyl/decaprenyl-phosphate alpha-N-acetylglucosaminyl 1-phosphate transferase [Acidimicrobiia bacterium]|nr:undecaprenyl/decaprenyl-phosphate alpha-N-acetylglucosaminyl 1-phosphate transferase [Acidimicrobiia bacterium]